MLLFLGLWLVAAVAGAEPEPRIDIELMVSHISDAAGGVDERGEELHAKLQREFRYQSLRVLESRSLRLALDEVGTVTLPNGKRARIRPLQLGEHGVLLAVDVEGSVLGPDGPAGAQRPPGGDRRRALPGREARDQPGAALVASPMGNPAALRVPGFFSTRLATLPSRRPHPSIESQISPSQGGSKRR
jgi:hypothetical protein